MPNIEPPVPLTDMQKVACVIHCCDIKAYKLPKPRNKKHASKTCQRLAHRKHSCVMHQLREKKTGKLEYTGTPPDRKPVNRFDNIQASPRFPNPGWGPKDKRKTLIPDIIVGDQIVDAKFKSCDPKKVKFSKGKGTVVNESGALSSVKAIGKKEKRDYSTIPGTNGKAKAMTPSDAKEKRGDCKCGKFQ